MRGKMRRAESQERGEKGREERGGEEDERRGEEEG